MIGLIVRNIGASWIGFVIQMGTTLLISARTCRQLSELIEAHFLSCLAEAKRQHLELLLSMAMVRKTLFAPVLSNHCSCSRSRPKVTEKLQNFTREDPNCFKYRRRDHFQRERGFG